MAKKEEKYCRECGYELTDVTTNRFDPYTGAPVHINKCMNVRCRVGCENNGGHEFHIFSSNCKRCGAYESWY